MTRERAAQRQGLPSIFTVRMLGGDVSPAADGERRPAAPAAGLQSGMPYRYDPSSPVQIVGLGGKVDPGCGRASATTSAAACSRRPSRRTEAASAMVPAKSAGRAPGGAPEGRRAGLRIRPDQRGRRR